jgi:integrase
VRLGEIFGLIWGGVDLKAGFIRLKEPDTKTGDAQSIPIGRELGEVLRHLPLVLDSQGPRVPYVFTRNGKRLKSVRKVFERVCQEAAIMNFVFHAPDTRRPQTFGARGGCVDDNEDHWT